MEYKTNMEGMPEGTYVTITWDSSFSNVRRSRRLGRPTTMTSGNPWVTLCRGRQTRPQRVIHDRHPTTFLLSLARARHNGVSLCCDRVMAVVTFGSSGIRRIHQQAVQKSLPGGIAYASHARAFGRIADSDHQAMGRGQGPGRYPCDRRSTTPIGRFWLAEVVRVMPSEFLRPDAGQQVS